MALMNKFILANWRRYWIKSVRLFIINRLSQRLIRFHLIQYLHKLQSIQSDYGRVRDSLFSWFVTKSSHTFLETRSAQSGQPSVIKADQFRVVGAAELIAGKEESASSVSFSRSEWIN